MKAQTVVGKVVVGMYWNERRRIKVDEVQELRGRTVLVGFDMDKGKDAAVFLDDFQDRQVRDYRAEAERTKSTAGMVIESMGARTIVRCGTTQDSMCRGARETDPNAVVYPIRAAI